MKCEICKDTGIIKSGPLEIEITCKCQYVREKKKEIITPIYHIKKVDSIMAVEKRLIPEDRVNDEYLPEVAITNIEKQIEFQKCSVKGFNTYKETLDNILLSISTGKLTKSYLIGAPNGFSKTTFVYTCIKRLVASNKKAVPYISLFELAELRVEHEKKILGYINKTKVTEEENNENGGIDNYTIEKYNWDDYIKADVVFVYLTTLDNKKVELSTLKTLLEIRGINRLPTIVFTTNALSAYTSDVMQRKIIWDDILSYDDEKSSYDRLIHRSTYKVYDNSFIANKKGRTKEG